MSRAPIPASKGTRPWKVAAVGAIISLVFLCLYLGVEPRGRMDFITLPAAQWGTPASLAAHGLEPLYLDRRETGWDGQFYFRMANDPLGTGDAPAHIDSPSYRYQRIGMSGTAWLLAHLCLQPWVSPLTFYLTSLLALFGACWAFAAYLRDNGSSPWFALIWSLGLGTQLTLLNGLPDGFAEAMVILAMLSLARPRPRPIFYALAMCLGVLSREAYVAAAGFIAVIYIIRLFQEVELPSSVAVNQSRLRQGLTRLSARVRILVASAERNRTAGHIVCMSAPLLTFVAWQIYLRLHFGKAPTEQAGGVLAPFLQQFMRFLRASISGDHPVFGKSPPMCHREMGMLVVFALLISLYFFATGCLLRRGRNFRNPAMLALALLPVIALYCFFGPVVMMHYSGYLKAANIVLFLVPFVVATLPLQTGLTRRLLLGLIAICGIAGSAQFFYDKILAGSLSGARPATFFENSRYHGGTSVASGQPALTNFAAEVKISGISSFYGRELFRELRGIPEIRTFDLQVTNQGTEAYGLADGVGAVRLSYHWLSTDGSEVVADGARTYFQSPLLPGETRAMRMYVEYPGVPGRYLLRISLVQEGVAWFYHHGAGYADLLVTVH